MSVTAATDREVFLKTSDGQVVVTTLAVVNKSAFVMNAAAACTAKGVEVEVDLPTISKATLDHVIEWLMHHIDEPYYPPPADADKFEVIEAERRTPVTGRDLAFFARIPDVVHRIELLTAAKFLQIMPLYYLTCKILGRSLAAGCSEQDIRNRLEQLGVPGQWLVHHIDEPSLVPERGTPISEWDEDLIARIPLQPERVDLLNAADYLKILPLSDLMISIFARRVNEHRNVDRIAKKLERLHAYSMRFEAQRASGSGTIGFDYGEFVFDDDKEPFCFKEGELRVLRLQHCDVFGVDNRPF
ncbi:hypothetical protein H9P43_002973 [Blastocladiella emersonii ATCC 22665]|nr:hypothetical protein H9P43_002973 [Blastocladiella emersonii ATCC 22665]